MQPQTELVKAISGIAAALPTPRTMQLYEFALFLNTHPLPGEEFLDDIAADEAIWDAQFASTDDHKLAALISAVEIEIGEGRVFPMFDEQGEFIDRA